MFIKSIKRASKEGRSQYSLTGSNLSAFESFLDEKGKYNFDSDRTEEFVSMVEAHNESVQDNIDKEEAIATALLHKENRISTTNMKTALLVSNQDSSEWEIKRRVLVTSTTATSTPLARRKQAHIQAVETMLKSESEELNALHNACLKMGSVGMMKHGTACEEEALYYYEEQTGMYVTKQNGLSHIVGTNMGGSEDALAYDENGQKRIVEIKSPNLYNFTDPEYYLNYIVQVHRLMLAHDCDEADIVLFFPSLPVKIFNVKRDEKVIIEIMGQAKEIDEMAKEEIKTISFR